MGTSEVITIIIIGIAAGVLSGLVGVGGGIILVPALIYFFKYDQHQAQGTSLGVLALPVVILAFLQYYKFCRDSGHAIDFRVIGFLALGFVFGGLFGGKIAARIDTVLMKKIFALILFYTAFKLLGWDSMLAGWIRSLFVKNSGG
jgi:uncharacterized membrane protein YfcA